MKFVDTKHKKNKVFVFFLRKQIWRTHISQLQNLLQSYKLQ